MGWAVCSSEVEIAILRVWRVRKVSNAIRAVIMPARCVHSKSESLAEIYIRYSLRGISPAEKKGTSSLQDAHVFLMPMIASSLFDKDGPVERRRRCLSCWPRVSRGLGLRSTGRDREALTVARRSMIKSSALSVRSIIASGGGAKLPWGLPISHATALSLIASFSCDLAAANARPSVGTAWAMLLL